ncbi:hypothetical protein ACFQ2T_10145 [Methylophilus flavus]|jgi:hypothetical protein|uniref:Uncharacterized protein n=1 Tax=Methylophilus flavus TaxID=640084 RepID=A0ABW3PEV9_9PROT
MRLKLFSIWIIVAGIVPGFALADEPVIAVIVSAQTAYTVPVAANDLSSVYWRKKLYDNHGKPLHPANLSSDHPLRLRFSQQVLHSSPRSQVGYWNEQYFHGIQPPYTVESQEAMIRYVAYTESAIGYIDACKVDERVKPVIWVTANKIMGEPPALRCSTVTP